MKKNITIEYLEKRIVELEKEIVKLQNFKQSSQVEQWELIIKKQCLADQISQSENTSTSLYPQKKDMLNNPNFSKVLNIGDRQSTKKLIQLKKQATVPHKHGKQIYKNNNSAAKAEQNNLPVFAIKSSRNNPVLGNELASGIIGHNSKVKELLETIKVISKLGFPVFIQGEPGTGKELIALAIHKQSNRSKKPFLSVDCSVYSPEQLEKELFGWALDSFTHANSKPRGKFELANGGTIFLKAITGISENIQLKILEILKDCKLRRPGNNETIPIDIQIISSTQDDLQNEVKTGAFNSELYYRISVIPLQIPALRNRKDDIPLLVDYFLEQAIYNGQNINGIAKDTLTTMIEYPWPGNVLELQSVVHYAIVRSKGQIIQPYHLPYEFKNYKCESPIEPKNNQPIIGRPCKLNVKRVREALTKSGGNKAKAARLLGVGRATLYNFLAHYPQMYESVLEVSNILK